MIKLSCKIKHNFVDLKSFATRINFNLNNEISIENSIIKKSNSKTIIETYR